MPFSRGILGLLSRADALIRLGGIKGADDPLRRVSSEMNVAFRNGCQSWGRLPPSMTSSPMPARDSRIGLPAASLMSSGKVPLNQAIPSGHSSIWVSMRTCPAGSYGTERCPSSLRVRIRSTTGSQFLAGPAVSMSWVVTVWCGGKTIQIA